MALSTNCGIVAEVQGRELVQHGSALFPIACYEEDMTCYAVPWHWHEELEYIVAQEGCVTVDVDKKRLCLQQGQGVLINSGVLHAVEFAERGPSRLRSAVFHLRLVGDVDTIYWQKLAKPLLAPGQASYFVLTGAEPWQAEILQLLAEGWQAVRKEESDDYENRTRYLYAAALHILTKHCPAQVNRTSQQEQVAAQRMKQMLRFVEEHYAEELSVEQIADSAALSESACLRSFRQMLGTTPIQYVKQYRVEKAAEMLLSTGLKAGEVGAECGFADTSYFTKTFREQKNCTPREYRLRFGRTGQDKTTE